MQFYVLIVTLAILATTTGQVQDAVPTSVEEILLSAPFGSPRANFFNAALEVPVFESAATLDAGFVYLRLRTTHARSNYERDAGEWKNDFDGTYHEWGALEASWGVIDRVEIGVRAVLSGWDEHIDRFLVFDESGRLVVSDEDTTFGATKRHDNVSVVGARAKLSLFEHEDSGVDLALTTSAKFPTGRPRDLTNAGTYDIAFTILGGVPLGPVSFHAAFGTTIPLGEQNLFERELDFALTPFVHGAFGITVVPVESFALGVQLEANSSAFGDVPFLDGPAFNVVAGARKIFGNFVLETGIGAGLDWKHSSQYSFFVSIGYLFE